MKKKIVLVQLGSPKSPKVSDVRKFLKEFLGDPRVVDLHPFFWKIILYCFILPFRPKKSAELYARIWNGQSFPLIDGTMQFAEQLRGLFPAHEYEVNEVFLLSEPRYESLWREWAAQEENARAEKWLIIPMFPQYSEATTASVIDLFFQELQHQVVIPDFAFMTHFHKSRAFIDASIKMINKTLKEQATDELVISFHGIPTRRVLYKKDPYYKHCYETFVLLKKGVEGVAKEAIFMSFQSRFGAEEWLGPYTDNLVKERVQKGAKTVAVYCPSFVVDCLETTDEIGHELKNEGAALGGDVIHIPCLNSDPVWCQNFAAYIKSYEAGQRSPLEYQLTEEEQMSRPEQTMQAPPLSDKTKGILKIVFLTLFLDLVGFSIIFPLFPALAKHYLTVDSDNYFLKLIFDSITNFMSSGGDATLSMSGIVLFGGALGAIYSLLQFIAAPLWGIISDRIGRKPVLLVSVFGLALSYVLWFFAGSFTLLIIARFVGGIMGGNISTATAVVADITEKSNRSKGMAIIGIAFALGFIIGPAMGGILSLTDLTQIYPFLLEYGVNPFSMAAGLAAILSFFNFYYIWKKFPETLPPEKRGKGSVDRTSNPVKLLMPLPYPGVNLTNFGHFLFLMAFSGMEFTLTFLAVERLSFSSLDNAYMFIFIGFVIAFVQGGVVRRKAAQVGEKKMALMGLVILIPGLICIGYTTGLLLLYLGLLFLATGSAMAIPCLTSLVSLYTPAAEQGRSIGIFRSLGALARVIGPMIAAIVYWRMGAEWPYWLGAIFLLIPILLIARLPKPQEV